MTQEPPGPPPEQPELPLPSLAHAHAIHPIWVIGALSPLILLLLVVFMAWLARSVRLGVAHAILLAIWVTWFWLASNFVTNDYLIWAPLVAYAVQSLVIVALIVRHAFARAREKRAAATPRSA